MNHTPRPPYPDLRFSETGGIDLQIVGKIAELDGNPHLDLGHGVARYLGPQPDGEQQGNQFESDVVKENTLEKAAMDKARHRQSFLSGRSAASRLGEGCELGGSSSIKLSSTGLGRVAVGA